jgi:hypothetical protein
LNARILATRFTTQKKVTTVDEGENESDPQAFSPLPGSKSARLFAARGKGECMNKKISPAMIGAFVLGAVALIVVALGPSADLPGVRHDALLR